MAARIILIGSLIVVSALHTTSAEDRQAAELKLARAELALAEKEFARTKRLVEASALPIVDLYAAEVTLSWARFQLARLQRDVDGVVTASESLARNYEQQVRRLEILAEADAISEDEVDQTRLLLAEARIRREFVRMVEIGNRRLERRKNLEEREAVSKTEVDRFRRKLEAAWDRVDANMPDE